jgi:uncharacterized damage-inducible protein DinB
MTLESRQMLNDSNVAREFSLESQRTLDEAVRKIEHCVRQLSDDDVWWRPSEEMNSVGNIILHLCGNVRQWVVSGVGGAPDVRDRPAEFAQREKTPREHLMAKLRATVDEAKATLDRCDAQNLLRARHVQHGEVTGLHAAYHSVSHFVGHTQEITYITRLRMGEKYQFLGITARSHK